MALSQTTTYDTASEFTFDATKIEIAAGKAQLKFQTYANETFFASYHEDINGHRGNGVLTGTGTGSPTVSGGKLDLKGPGVKFVSYAAADNSMLITTGTVRIGYIPNYTGNPAADRMVFSSGPVSGSNNILIIFHRTDNKFIFQMRDSSGDLITDLFTSNLFSATAGTLIDIELDLDLTGTTRIFINGVLEMSTTDTGTRSQADFINIGTDAGKTLPTDCEIDYFQIYSDVKNTSNFTPLAEAFDYSAIHPTILVNTPTLVDGITLFSEVATKVDSEIKYTINFSDEDRYWTGSVWATSDGTYAQANTAAEINTNVSTLDLSAGCSFRIKAFLHSNTGYASPTLTSNTFTYSFFVVFTAPNECIVYGWVKDAKGAGVSGVTVKAQALKPFFHGENLISDMGDTTTNSAGYWEMSLVETATLSLKISLQIVGRVPYTVIIPDLVSAALSGLEGI